jgi:hypothetical protein
MLGVGGVPVIALYAAWERHLHYGYSSIASEN